MSNVYLLRMLNGEELLASMEKKPSPADQVLNLKNVVRVVVIPSKVDPKAPSIGLAPFTQFSNDDDITIDKRHVLAIMTPIKQFTEQYKALFSKVLTPENNQGLILPK